MEEVKQANAEVKAAYDLIINERKNLLFMQKCTKVCPNKKCAFQIQKIDGCNKMLCGLCQTKFCWNCNEILNGLANPYDHFANNTVCVLFGNVAVQNNLTEQELHAMEDENRFAEMLTASENELMNPLDIFMCPGCCCSYIRDRSKLNIINCIVCNKKLCFMCKKVLSTSLTTPNEDLKEHFEVSFCYY